MNTKPIKPLGKKAYGSTPHLLGSRLGPADHSITESQTELFTGIRKRHGDRFIVTEKIDGSCVSIAKHDNDILSLSRSGYLASDCPYEVHKAFNRWTLQRKSRLSILLLNGERLVGEWLYTAMGTKYLIDDPERLLIGFSIINEKGRIPFDEFKSRMTDTGLLQAHVISDGPAISPEEAMAYLGSNGFHGALDGTEGAVWVHESKGKFQSIAKFVKHDKIDGKYIPSISGKDEITNYIGPEF